MIGKFITFEGGDGCGKSTQIGLLFDAMMQAGMDVVKTREPGGTDGANAIRKLLVEGDFQWDGITESLLHFAARRDHVQKLIDPRLARGEWIICDRFIDSTVAYQGYGYGLDREVIDQLHKLSVDSAYPDLTLIFDIDVQKGLERTNSRNDNNDGNGAAKEDRYEKMDISFHQNLREGFLSIAKDNPQRCLIINADDSIANIHHKVCAVLKQRFDLELSPML